MSASRIEELLERLVEQNDDVLDVMRTMSSSLENVENSLDAFKEEVLEKLEHLQKLESIDDALTGDVSSKVDAIKSVLESELVWTENVSSAAMILEQLRAIHEKLGTSTAASMLLEQLQAIEEKVEASDSTDTILERLQVIEEKLDTSSVDTAGADEVDEELPPMQESPGATTDAAPPDDALEALREELIALQRQFGDDPNRSGPAGRRRR